MFLRLARDVVVVCGGCYSKVGEDHCSGRIIPHMRVNSFPSAQCVLARQSGVDRQPVAD